MRVAAPNMQSSISPKVLQRSSKIGDEWRYPPVEPFRSGKLQTDTDPDHQIYWEQYGKPDGEPVMVLHGGPGGACSPVMARFFDPQRYCITLFDQRGCGKSAPTVAEAGPTIALQKNTTQDLISDINKLRAALGIERKMHVFGGSWGSTLAMAYAIEFPENCATLVLRGIFLGEAEDLLYMYQGNAATYASDPFALTQPGAYVSYPEAWADFLNVIDPVNRADVMRAYKTIFDSTPSTAAAQANQLDAALAWSKWEGTISNMIPEPDDLAKFANGEFALSFAQIEAHYFANRLFLSPNYFVQNADILAQIPIHIVHGRYDQVCPLTQASRLVAALRAAGAEPENFLITNAGHSAMERENALALTEIMDNLSNY